VEISREELAERFRELTDEDLLARVGGGTLTPLALEVGMAELRARGLALPEEPVHRVEPADASEAQDDGPGAPPQDLDLVTVAVFWNPLQANVLRACLESHGIFAYVWGEHLGVAHIFMSVASGGMRVQVRSDQLAEARKIMAALERGELAIDESPE
jgi:hypothetical protein